MIKLNRINVFISFHYNRATIYIESRVNYFQVPLKYKIKGYLYIKYIGLLKKIEIKISLKRMQPRTERE